MSDRNDGGPAFPILKPQNPNFEYCDPGMTLRDWFAGQALAGILANPNIHKEANALGVPCVNIAVPAAYVAADAMLEARK